MTKLPANHVNVLVVRDVLPHLDAALDHPAAQRILTDPRWAEMDGEGLPDIATMKANLATARPYVPLEVVIAFPDAARTDAIRWFELALVGSLAVGAGESAADAGTADQRTQLQQLTLEHVKQLAVPRGAIMVRMPREDEAAMAMNYAWILSMGLAQHGIQTRTEGNRLAFTLTFGQHVDDDIARAIAVEWGIADDLESDHVTALVEAMADEALEVALERRGDELILTLGPPWQEGEPTLTAEALGGAVRGTARGAGLRAHHDDAAVCGAGVARRAVDALA